MKHCELAKLQRQKALAAYNLHPVRCANPACSGHLAFYQYQRGQKYCTSMCSAQAVAGTRRGKPNPAGRTPRAGKLHTIAIWNGEVKHLTQDPSPDAST